MSSSFTSKFSLAQRFLQRVLDSTAKPSDEERTEANDAVRKLQDRLMSTMKELDDFFVTMKPSFSLKGSVKKRLKVRQYDEFDLNLTMHLPLDESQWSEVNVEEAEGEETHTHTYASWFACEFPSSAIQWPVPRARRRKAWRNIFEPVRGCVDGRVRLRADGLRNWMQGLIHRACRSGRLSDLGDVSESRSGPAITLAYSPKEGGICPISIDVVPSIRLPDEIWQPTFDDSVRHLLPAHFERCLVPVAPRVPPGAPPPPRHLLRGTFPHLEEALYTKEYKSVSLDVVRLLKVVRDENEWFGIASFFLENACTNYCVSHRMGISAQEGYAPDREEMFVNVLRDLGMALHEGRLPMTLFPRCNLLVKQKLEFRKNAADRLRKILRRLHFHLEEQNEEATNRVLADLFHPRRRLELEKAL